MDYEKAYKKALERAKKVHKYSSDIAEIKRMEDIFPELKESEDEKIRKAQLDYWRSVGGKEWHGVPVQEVIVWLEKQQVDGFDAELKESEDEEIRKELIEHIKANCESDFILFQKFSPDDVIAWLEKQGEKKEINPTLQEKERMDDAFTKMMLKPQVDGFDTELNSLLKKYEHLPKEEILGCLNFYVLVLGKEIEERQ